MNKRIIAVLALAALVASGAFAQLALGATGAIYSETGMKPAEVIEKFQDGDGIFYGPFVEIGLGKLAIGAAGNFSFYEEDFSYLGDGSYMVEMMDYDVDIYLQGHLFRYKSFIDPFLEAGIGMMAKDYANAEDDPDTDAPIMGTKYFQAGGGLGLNFGALGIFTKVLYMFPFGTVEGTYSYYDETGYHEGTYSLAEYPLTKLKIYLGAKLIL